MTDGHETVISRRGDAAALFVSGVGVGVGAMASATHGPAVGLVAGGIPLAALVALSWAHGGEQHAA